MVERRPRKAGRVSYWSLVVCLLGFGFLAQFSIGVPFFLLGLVLAVLFPFRHRVGVVAAGVASVIGFTAGYLLVAPLGCTSTDIARLNGVHSVIGRTTCNSLLGWNYSGRGVYNPSLLPSLLTAMVAATIFATVVYRSLRSFHRLSRNEPTPAGASPP
jgi:hypothetical protein